MRRSVLAKRLINAQNSRERQQLFSQHSNLADTALAREIQKQCYSVWTTEPARTRGASAAMSLLISQDRSKEILAIADWVAGIAAITEGKFSEAVERLTRAEESFVEAGAVTDAAQTRVAKLLALAMLGRYDEAVETGRSALKIFDRSGDELAAGKIEMNLSNVAARRERHREAEGYALAARKRFIKAAERTWQTMAENDLANTYTEMNELDKAGRFYRLALDGARAAKMGVTEAEIEASLGNLARLRGQYADALRYLESSRLRYERLDMPHQYAIAELEIADIYAELNLLKEAGEIYTQAICDLHSLNMRADEARARLNHGRTFVYLSNWSDAITELRQALRLFEREQNQAGRAAALLAISNAELRSGNLKAGRETAAAARRAVKSSENPRHHIFLALLEGDIALRSGHAANAETSYSTALRLAQQADQAAAVETAHTSLGDLAAAGGDLKTAATEFRKAIKTIEAMRSPLVSEFSMSLLAAHLAPYEKLSRLLLDSGAKTEALKVIEAGRSRALLDVMNGRRSLGRSAALERQLSEIRSELNVLYGKLDTAAPDEQDRLRRTTKNVENDITRITRRIGSLGGSKRVSAPAEFSLADLRKRLGDSTVLVEFIEIDESFAAFVISGRRMAFVRLTVSRDEIKALLDELRFQFGSMRYGGDVVSRFGAQLKQRTDRCLALLYDRLMRPLMARIGGERLVVVPAGLLHYVPFPALFDGTRYLTERFEITNAPSAAVWNALNARRRRKASNSLIVSYADERIPQVEEEAGAVEAVAPSPKRLAGGDANFAAVLEHLPSYDMVHLACHGQFRADNPMYSSLHLADGWLTVRDVVARDLRASLVTLSACETGMSELFAGDELLGLARGFLSAGAQDLIVSLWSVNDEATGRLMSGLYRHLQRGLTPSASLRRAQIGFIERGEHPYLWSPFIIIGR